LKIPVAGIEQFLHPLPDGSCLYLSGSMEGCHSFFAQTIGHAAYKGSREVVYITSRSIDDTLADIRRIEPERIPFYIVENAQMPDWPEFLSSKSVLIIDSYSYLILGSELKAVKEGLESLRKKVKEVGGNLILVSHGELIDPTVDAITRYNMDGIIDFETGEDDEFVRRYMRIQKWFGVVLEQFIYYKLEQGRFDIDLRARVI